MAKNIVILGAGFGGVRAANVLSKKLGSLGLWNKYQIFLVDRNDFHTFTPLLYEAAVTPREAANDNELKSLVTYPLKELIKNPNVVLVADRVMHIDLGAGAAHLTHGRLTFEYLVLAMGSETNYFNIPGLEKHSLALKSLEDALQIRNAIEELLLKKKDDIEILIGGAGSTGIELAAEIESRLCETNKTANPCNAHIAILEATSTILPGFDARVIKRVAKRLTALGIGIKTRHMIKEAEPNRVVLTNGEILPYDLLIWTGGVKAATLTKQLSFKKEPKGRIEIVSSLECLPEGLDLKIYGRIYAIGDIACVYDPKTNRPVPQVARAAITQGKIAALNIIEEIKKEMGLSKKAIIRIYRPVTYPYVIPVGAKYAVCKFGPFVISGFFGWILKGLVELNYLISIMPLAKSLKIWVKGLRVFIQNDRLG